MQQDALQIGRAQDCGWVLNDPDRAVSAHHCTIALAGDQFEITDTSSNGVFVNGARRPLGRGCTAILSDGDLLGIGPYRVRVSIETAAAVEAPASMPDVLRIPADGWIGSLPAAGFGDARTPAQPGWSAPPDASAHGGIGLTMLPRDGVGLAALSMDRPGVGGLGGEALFSPFAAQSEHGSAVATVMRVPVAKAMLPHDWDLAGDVARDPLAPASSPAVPSSDLGPAQHRAAIDAFIAGLALPRGSLDGVDTVAAFAEFGRMLRASVLGLRDLLGARKLAKAELRVESTVVKASGNNALKMSPDGERTLAAIAGQPTPGYLPGVDAIEEGVRDIKAHELALVATISILLNDVAMQLDPASIKARVAGSGGLLAAPARARYWTEYERAYAALTGSEPGADASGAASLMGRFAQAYAAQVQHSVGPVRAASS